MFRFAIITPMYNAAATIGATIDSVLRQSVTDWQWLLMDDGSSDGTAELVEARLGGDARASLVRCGRVGHIGTLRNRALEQVTATYVCFLDADDQWSPSFLESQEALLLRTRASVAHTAARHIVSDRIVDVPPKYHGPAVCDPPEMLRQLYPRNPIYSPSVAMETDVLRSVGAFSEHPDHFSVLDLDLWLRLATKCRFAYNPEPLLFYRVSEYSLSSDSKNQMRNWRGQVLALEASVAGADDLPADLRCMLKRYLNRSRAQYARHLLDESPPALELSRAVFLQSWREGLCVNRYLPFQLLSLAGCQPPYLLHRALRRLRG